MLRGETRLDAYRGGSRGGGEEHFDNHFATISFRGAGERATNGLLKEQAASSIIRAHPGRRHSTEFTHTHTHTAGAISVPGPRRCGIGGLGPWDSAAHRLIGSPSCQSAGSQSAAPCRVHIWTEIALTSSIGCRSLVSRSQGRCCCGLIVIKDMNKISYDNNSLLT